MDGKKQEKIEKGYRGLKKGEKEIKKREVLIFMIDEKMC